MAAVVNTYDRESDNLAANITTPGVTPGGDNRAVIVFTVAQDAGVVTEVKYTNDSGAAISDYTTGTYLLDVLGFVNANTKAFGEAGSPDTSTTIYTETASTSQVIASFPIFLEDVDQTTPFGTEFISADIDCTTSPVSPTVVISGLDPDTLIVGALVLFLFVDTITSVTATDSDTNVLATETSVQEENRVVSITGVWGVTDGSGDLTLSCDVVWSAGVAMQARFFGIPVNEAAGGGGLDVTLAISGGYTFSGAAPLTRIRVQGVSGGITYGGTAPISFDGVQIYTITPSGGITFGGAASFALTHVIPVSGGIEFTGAAKLGFTKTLVPSGGIEFSGAVGFGKTKVFGPSGGITFSGSSPISFTPAGSGGVGDGSHLRMVGIGVAN